MKFPLHTVSESKLELIEQPRCRWEASHQVPLRLLKLLCKLKCVMQNNKTKHPLDHPFYKNEYNQPNNQTTGSHFTQKQQERQPHTFFPAPPPQSIEWHQSAECWQELRPHGTVRGIQTLQARDLGI